MANKPILPWMLLASVIVHVVLLLGLLWFSQGGGAPAGQVSVSVKMVGLATSAVSEPDVQASEVENSMAKESLIKETDSNQLNIQDSAISSSELARSTVSTWQADIALSEANQALNKSASKLVADNDSSNGVNTDTALTKIDSQPNVEHISIKNAQQNSLQENTLQKHTLQKSQEQVLNTAYENYRDELSKLLSTYHYYPRKARRMGWEGTVKLQLLKNTQGQIETQLIASSGFDSLDQSAINTLEKALAALPPPSLLLTDQFSLHVPFQFSLD